MAVDDARERTRSSLICWSNCITEACPFPSLGRNRFGSLVKILASIYNHHGALGNIIVTLITVAGIMSSFLRYEFFTIIHNSSIGTAVYTTVWVTLLISSIWCSVLYVQILYDCWAVIRTIWSDHWNIYRIILFIVLMACAMISIRSLYSEMYILMERAKDFQTFWMRVYTFLFIARLVQRTIACGFTVLVMPIAKHWADKVSFSAKDYTIQLIPWKTFHLLQRFFLYMTFFDAYFKGVIHQPTALFTYGFMASIWIWAVMLAVYIMDAWMDQRLGESHVQSTNDQLVSGLTPIILNYPPKSELVRGDVSKRFEELVEPSKTHKLLMEKEKEEELDREMQEKLRREEQERLRAEVKDDFIAQPEIED